MTPPSSEDRLVQLLSEVHAPDSASRWRGVDPSSGRGWRLPRLMVAPALAAVASVGVLTVAAVSVVLVHQVRSGPVAQSMSPSASLQQSFVPTSPGASQSATASGSAAPTGSGRPAGTTAPAPATATPSTTAHPSPTSKPSPTASPTPHTQPGVFTFAPTADAYVNSDNPDTNYGSAGSLVVGSNPLRHTYIKFTVAGLVGTVTNVQLRLYVTSTGGGFSDRPVADNSWSEGAITDNNAPTYGGVAFTDNSVDSTGWWTIDATGLVTGNGTYTIALTSATAVTFDSREAGSAVAPQLVVTTH